MQLILIASMSKFYVNYSISTEKYFTEMCKLIGECSRTKFVAVNDEGDEVGVTFDFGGITYSAHIELYTKASRLVFKKHLDYYGEELQDANVAEELTRKVEE